MILNDAMLVGPTNYTNYVETRMDYATTGDLGLLGNDVNNETAAFLSIIIQMDEWYRIYERDAFTFIQAIS